MDLTRRGILGMLAAGVGAAIVRPGLLMPIKGERIIIPKRAPTAAELNALNRHAFNEIAASFEAMRERVMAEAFNDVYRFGTGVFRNNADGSIMRINPLDVRTA